MYSKLIDRDNITYEIIYKFPESAFQNSDRSINKKVLGMFVAEVKADRVILMDKKLLICKEIEDAQYEEM